MGITKIHPGHFVGKCLLSGTKSPLSFVPEAVRCTSVSSLYIPLPKIFMFTDIYLSINRWQSRPTVTLLLGTRRLTVGPVLKRELWSWSGSWFGIGLVSVVWSLNADLTARRRRNIYICHLRRVQMSEWSPHTKAAYFSPNQSDDQSAISLWSVNHRSLHRSPDQKH